MTLWISIDGSWWKLELEMMAKGGIRLLAGERAPKPRGTYRV